jgi:methyl-accepting chemotaxis protein
MTSFTPEERINYWKKRIFDKILSMSTQLTADFKSIDDNVDHINLDTREIRKAYTDINKGLANLAKAVQEAKTMAEIIKKQKKDIDKKE